MTLQPWWLTIVVVVFLIAGAKVESFCEPTKCFGVFFQKKFVSPHFSVSLDRCER